ncbi:MAG: group I truncated hemoglobin [Kangiellaceae bacterium]
MASAKRKEYEEMGGKHMLEHISKIFYDKIYDDPWLKQYFAEIPQEHIERQQVAFMQAALGGENLYCGQTPPTAHKHMYITEELFQARQLLLDEAFAECNASPLLIEKWIRIDEAFFNRIVKSSPEECEKRYKSDKILNFQRPNY